MNLDSRLVAIYLKRCLIDSQLLPFDHLEKHVIKGLLSLEPEKTLS